MHESLELQHLPSKPLHNLLRNHLN